MRVLPRPHLGAGKAGLQVHRVQGVFYVLLLFFYYIIFFILMMVSKLWIYICMTGLQVHRVQGVYEKNKSRNGLNKSKFNNAIYLASLSKALSIDSNQ